MNASLEIIEDLKRKGLVCEARHLGSSLSLVPTGIRTLDDLCGGGLPCSRISEIITGCLGASSVVFSVLAQATRQEAAAALVDPAHGFDAMSASAHGVSLERLLWVLAPGAQALRAGELILAAEGFHTMVMDLSSETMKLSNAAWMRMDSLARRSKSVVLVLSRKGVVGPFAHTVVRVRSCRPVWRRGGEVTNAASPVCLARVELDFALHRRRSA